MIYGIKSGSRHCDCKKCIYGETVTEHRKTVRENTVIYQQPGSVNCTCEKIHEFTIGDGGIICSSFREKEGGDGF